jgi:hypothetical protein
MNSGKIHIDLICEDARIFIFVDSLVLLLAPDSTQRTHEKSMTFGLVFSRGIIPEQLFRGSNHPLHFKLRLSVLLPYPTISLPPLL